METRTSENEDFPGRLEFLKEYKNRIDSFYSSSLKYPTPSEEERFGSVGALLEMFGKCAAADAARDALAKGSTFEL